MTEQKLIVIFIEVKLRDKTAEQKIIANMVLQNLYVSLLQS